MNQNNITLDKFKCLADDIYNPIMKAIGEVINNNLYRYTEDRPSTVDDARYDCFFEITPAQFERVIDSIYAALRNLSNENKDDANLLHSANCFKYFVDYYAEALRVFGLNEKKGDK